MAWEVKLRIEWPNNSFRRDGIVFTKDSAVVLEKLSNAIKNEPALVKIEVKGKKKEKTETKAKGKK